MSLNVFKKHMQFDSNIKVSSNSDEESEKLVFGNQLPTLKEIQTVLVNEALKRTNNNQSIAAKMLGVTRQALNKRIIQEKKAS